MGFLILFVLIADQGQYYHQSQDSLTRVQQEDKWIAWDKFHHFSYSFGITGLSYHIYHCQLNNPESEARILSISLTAILGVSKEIYDKYHDKAFISYKDLVADALGITLATLIFTLYSP
ncbi:hypothetical protein KAW65_00515 [candidate division WOR-3 bacterium]|nr:hypothetical protein [candidate division WOR-3 bacterium]